MLCSLIRSSISVNTGPRTNPFASHVNAVHILTSRVIKIYFNIISLICLKYTGWMIKQKEGTRVYWMINQKEGNAPKSA